MEKQAVVKAGLTPSDETDKKSVAVVGKKAYSEEELKHQKKAAKVQRLKTMGI